MFSKEGNLQTGACKQEYADVSVLTVFFYHSNFKKNIV